VLANIANRVAVLRRASIPSRSGIHIPGKRSSIAARCSGPHHSQPIEAAKAGSFVRKLIAFDEDTFDKLKQLGRDRMATFQELADEAFADLLKKHGIPIDLKDALRKSASMDQASAKKAAKPAASRKSKT